MHQLLAPVRTLCAMAVAALAGLSLPQLACAQDIPEAGMLRYPDVSATHIAFAYADDLWIVSREGGVAMPLASPLGSEMHPRFNDDGTQIAFVGNYEAGEDLYIVPSTGGIAQRFTYHPAKEMLCDWTPDGALLFSSNEYAGLQRMSQLLTISEEHPFAELLDVPYGSNGAISPDGQWLAYTPYSRDTRTWKRYRGGMASDIWLFHLESHRSQQVTDWEGTDTLPMWHDDQLYYLSDAGPEHRLNIWKFDTNTQTREQITKHANLDVKWPAMGPGPSGAGEIVYQQGSALRLLDLSTGKSKAVEIRMPGDRPRIRRQIVDAAEFISGASISPEGKRVAIEARGDIWTAPAKHGTPRNLTATSGVAERYPAWSPDGRWIAYFSDASGEYELMIMQSDGRGETRQLTEDGTHWRYSPVWSPDSKRIAFTDKTGAIYLHTLASMLTKKVDREPSGSQPTLTWSHDSRFIGYDKSADTPVGNQAIWVYDIDQEKALQLTSGYFSDSQPAFDRAGEFLYYQSNRRFSNPQYEDLGTSFIYRDTGVLLALPLRAEVKNPLLPKVDQVSWKQQADEPEKKGEGKSDADADAKKNRAKNKKKAKKKDNKPAQEKDEDGQTDSDNNHQSLTADKDEHKDKDSNKNKAKAGEANEEDGQGEDGDQGKAQSEPKDLEIEFEGAERRSIPLPIASGSFGSLVVNKKGQLIYRRQGTDGPSTIHLFDIHAEDPKQEDVGGGGAFELSADGQKLLLMQGGKLSIAEAAAGKGPGEAVSTEGMLTTIEPRLEWEQIFHEAWRLQRDFFYDPQMHGVDWSAVRKRYAKLLKDANSRSDVGFIIGEMISELNVGHAYYRGTDTDADAPSSKAAVFGCRLQASEGRFRVAEFWQGAAWDTDAQSPLQVAGVRVGQYLLDIEGRELTTDANPYAALQGLGGKLVTITVSDDPQRDADDRRIDVRLPSDDSDLRFRHWIEKNRAHVAQASEGRIGYIYVTNTGQPGQNDLFRQFYAQADKDALIIDDRWNGGGQIPTRFIELLNRPATNFWARRDGRDWRWPPDSHQGPKCMLINGLAGSGGDMFPALFKQAGLGKLIGRRTWGGLVGISGGPSLIDGASVTVPSFAYYELDGTWGIEGHGVDPDIEVIDDPAQMLDGADPQLTAAIEHLQQELKDHPFVPPERPAYPDRAKMGLTPADK